MSKIKVGVVGYGTIGKRVADSVMLQEDMELVGVTGNSYNFRMEQANKLGMKIFLVADNPDFKANGIKTAGKIEDLIKSCDIIVDGAPKKVGKENKAKYYEPNKVKAVFQGGEKKDLVEASFVAQCNYDEALNKDYVRVVSCNTTGLSRTLNALDNKFGLGEVTATMIRRAADPCDTCRGPINGIVPTMELPSHHGPDVQTILKDLTVLTTAVVVPTTLMHLHTLVCEMKKEVKPEEVIELLKNTPRIKVLKAAHGIESTAEIMELARDLGRKRSDMMEICIWEEGVGVHGNKLFLMQAVHQESDVVPENIDCIRAMMGFEDGKKSMEMTDKSLQLGI